MKDKILWPIKVVLGLVLYTTSRDFRELVNGKLRSSTDDTVSSGEEIVVVLTSVVNNQDGGQ